MPKSQGSTQDSTILNDTINILDSLHRLDTEGDRTKDEERLQGIHHPLEVHEVLA